MKERLDEQQKKMGLSIFLGGSGIVLFYFIIKNLPVIGHGVATFVGILSPFIYGLVMAYLLCPAYNAVVRKVYHRAARSMANRRAFVLAKVLASIVSVILIFAVIGAVVALILPQTVKSIITLIDILPQRMEDFTAWLADNMGESRYAKFHATIQNAVNHAYDYLMKIAEENLLPGVGSYIERITSGVLITLRTLLNILIGIVVCVYFLNSKETFKAQAKKLVVANFRRDRADNIFDFGNFADKTFGGFITGKIIDSIIIGLLCFVLMLIFKMPYAALCSTIIGVTNIIPFFGPFIGAIPTSIIIFIINPIQAGAYIIMIFALQQFDGNILGPKILGGSTGLASFWVMFSIIIFGGMFGPLGMILGVPVFAIFYYYFKQYLDKKLARKGIENDTWEYLDLNKYDIDRKDVKP